jgi:heterodisulfide reductase subunit C
MNAHLPKGTLIEKAYEETGENYNDCYQCGKCSAGCPMGLMMDIPPHQVIRLVQLGGKENEEMALRSRSIWICLSCETCSTRCPQEVEPAHIMDFMRHEAYRRKMVHPDAARILRFHKIFLESIRQRGRIYEVDLIAKMKIGDAFSANIKELMRDVGTAPLMLAKGKLPIFGDTIGGHSEIAKIYEKCLGLSK